MNKAGGGYTRDGLPFLKCICCCTREAINRTKLKELGIFEIWAETLRMKEIPNTERPEHSESDQKSNAEAMKSNEASNKLLMEAKSIILLSIPNFYYDEDSLLSMIKLDYCLYLTDNLKEIFIKFYHVIILEKIVMKISKRKHYYLILRTASQIINRQQRHLVIYQHFIIQQHQFQLNRQWKHLYK